MMPYTLTTTLSKILLIPNRINLNLINEFHDQMKSKGCSERHRNNTLHVMIGLANFLGCDRTFYDIERKEQILEFLNTKIKSTKQDPDEKWITTWNHYLARKKLFFRWITNRSGECSESEWQTPTFMQIKEKKSIRKSPYSESQIWDRDELPSILKYEPEIRNKAILTLLWDLDARNHEVTALKLGNIRLRERYAEGEIPHNTKTGGGPIKETVTFVGRPTSAGVLHGEGHGVLMGGESEMATFRGEAFGRISSSGSVKWRGAHFYRTTSSTGKLAFLNNVVGVFEAEIDAEGNVTEKIWEWK